MSLVKVTVPGRTEVAGNHEDHQGGCVIAATVDRHITCTAQLQNEHLITVDSDGFNPFALDLDAPTLIEPRLTERYSVRSLVRGMAAQLMEEGYDIPGCRLVFESTIPVGMGLSSSAAFELCCGTALMELAKITGSQGRELSPLDMAKMAVQTERQFFGKPSGLMDQAICELGGVNYIDFEDADNLLIEPVVLPPSWDEYTCLLVDCGSGHEDATDDYAQVALDMHDVARSLQIKQLRDISLDDYLKRFESVREKLGDRAALRGLHFYNELDLVKRRLAALQNDDLDEFVILNDLSGVSSAEYLHNVSMPTSNQPAMVALAFSRMALRDSCDEHRKIAGTSVKRGSARIHGGGFGGTIQVFLPREQVEIFCNRIDDLLGNGHCEEIQLGTPGIQVVSEL